MDFDLLESLVKIIPVVIAFAAVVFRMDLLFPGSNAKPQRASRTFCGFHQPGIFVFADPDGRDNRRRPRT